MPDRDSRCCLSTYLTRDVRDHKIKLYRDQDKRKILTGPGPKKNFSRTRTGAEKKLPGPGPKKVGPAHLYSGHLSRSAVVAVNYYCRFQPPGKDVN